MRFLLDLPDVVQALKAIAALKPLFHIEDIAHQLVIFVAGGDPQLRRRFLDRTKRFHHQHGVMRYDRATPFTHNRRMRNAFRITNIHDIPHDVVGVFLERIICRAIEVATRAVVIDAKPAADIQISELVSKLRNLCIITGRFADRALDD